MPSLIQLILIAACAAAFFLTLKRGRQGAISRGETFAWSLLWLGAAVVALLPDVSTVFARLLGVGRGADAVLYVSIVALFYLVFRIFVRLDKLDRDITSLVRTVSLARRDDADKK